MEYWEPIDCLITTYRCLQILTTDSIGIILYTIWIQFVNRLGSFRHCWHPPRSLPIEECHATFSESLPKHLAVRVWQTRRLKCSKITLMKIAWHSIPVKCRMSKGGAFEGVWTPPTEGGGSCDWLQYVGLCKCHSSRILRNNAPQISLVGSDGEEHERPTELTTRLQVSMDMHEVCADRVVPQEI